MPVPIEEPDRQKPRPFARKLAVAAFLSAVAVLFCLFIPVVKCPNCDGEGQIVPPPVTDGGRHEVTECPRCKGFKSLPLCSAWAKWTDPRNDARSHAALPPVASTPIDPVQKQRYETEGKALLAEGKLDAALLKFAAAEGASNPPEYVRGRLAKTRADVERLAGGRIGMMSGAEKPLLNMGPWALAVLVEGLAEDIRDLRFPAVSLLSAWGEEADPALAEAARSGNGRMRRGAVSVLLQRGGSRYPQLPAILKERWADPEEDQGIKADVRKLYFMIVQQPIEGK